MRIEDVDKNFTVNTPQGMEGLHFINSLTKPFITHGLIYDAKLGQYLRMPAEAAENISDSVKLLNKHTSGGRVRFKTDSGSVAIKCLQNHSLNMPHMTQTGQSGFSLYVDNIFYKTFIPPYGDPKTYDGFTVKVDFPNKTLHNITIYFPLYNEVKSLYIGLEKESFITAPDDYCIKKPILFYGSSITQGACASRPGNSYDAILCRYLDADYINLGFSGSARGEPAMAKYLAGIESSVFMLDYDYNALDLLHLKKTHNPLYTLYRKSNPDTPIVMLSKPDFDNNKDASIKRRDIIINSYKKCIATGDKNLYFVDGETLFGDTDRDGCTVDKVHPNDLGFYRMAETVYKAIKIDLFKKLQNTKK